MHVVDGENDPVPLELKVTVPVGLDPVTVAVQVTEDPAAGEDGEQFSEVLDNPRPTTNTADALFPEPSVAVTLCVPPEDGVIVKVTDPLVGNDPLGPVITEAGAVVWAMPSYATVRKDEEAKPLPEMVTVAGVPTAPLAGLMLMDGVTVKVDVAEFELESVALTVWAPLTDGGTWKVALNAPVESLVIVGGFVATGEPS